MECKVWICYLSAMCVERITQEDTTKERSDTIDAIKSDIMHEIAQRHIQVNYQHKHPTSLIRKEVEDH